MVAESKWSHVTETGSVNMKFSDSANSHSSCARDCDALPSARGLGVFVWGRGHPAGVRSWHRLGGSAGLREQPVVGALHEGAEAVDHPVRQRQRARSFRNQPEPRAAVRIALAGEDIE